MATLPTQLRGAPRTESVKTAKAAAEVPTVAISYLESAPVRVLGLATGHTYEFSASRAMQQVDPRDAGALLHTGLFRRV